ncbi:MAG: mobilization protein [Steroidobacteraceae bacterium]
MAAKAGEHSDDALELKLRQLRAQQQRVVARRQTVLVRRTRREDTRRKILVGAVVLEKVETGEIPEATLHTWLKGALTRAEDRALFGLA